VRGARAAVVVRLGAGTCTVGHGCGGPVNRGSDDGARVPWGSAEKSTWHERRLGAASESVGAGGGCGGTGTVAENMRGDG
jgi:hypothetical protein